mgnify:CR=1 FL=1
MITVLDYDAGNIKSVENALNLWKKRLDSRLQWFLTDRAEMILFTEINKV